MEEVGEKLDIFMQKEEKILFAQKMLSVLCLTDIINMVNIQETTQFKQEMTQLVY